MMAYGPMIGLSASGRPAIRLQAAALWARVRHIGPVIGL